MTHSQLCFYKQKFLYATFPVSNKPKTKFGFIWVSVTVLPFVLIYQLFTDSPKFKIHKVL